MSAAVAPVSSERRAVALAALSGLPNLGPRTLSALLRSRSAEDAWRWVCSGRIASDPAVAATLGRDPAGRAATWCALARRTELDALAVRHRAARVRILVHSDEAWPERLRDDPEPPAVLCMRGRIDGALPACAIVGTRACSPDGRRIAYALGRDLAEAGVAVVSGLALGIDAAAHRGCLAAGGVPVGVVAAGVDVVYPPSHGDLFAAVARSGALVSEAPVGTRPERWRFPARNRLIAALCDAVVVVESGVRGGSLHTVDAALERQRIVGAVPGSVLSRTSDGTNALLADGALLVRGADDVLVALGLDPRGSAAGAADAGAALKALGSSAAAVYASLGVAPVTVDEVVTGSGLGLGPTLVALQQLSAAGLADDVGGRWSRAGVGA